MELKINLIYFFVFGLVVFYIIHSSMVFAVFPACIDFVDLYLIGLFVATSLNKNVQTKKYWPPFFIYNVFSIKIIQLRRGFLHTQQKIDFFFMPTTQYIAQYKMLNVGHIFL